MKFTKETFYRAWRTALQAFLAFLGTQLIQGVDFSDLKNWAFTVLAGGIGAVIGALMNLETNETTIG